MNDAESIRSGGAADAVEAPAGPPAAPASSSLLQKILRETLGYAALALSGQVFAWLSNLVLARLLFPKDFGIFDICCSFITLGGILGDGGVGAALIRKPGKPTNEEYESVFVSTIVVGAILAIGFSVCAPFIASAYHLEHQAMWILVALAPTYLIGSAKSYPMVRLERDLKFSSIARIDLGVLFLRHASAITLAFLGKGVWALVTANVLATVVGTAATFAMYPGLPRFRFSRAAFMPLLSFGIKVQALSVTAFFKDNVSNFLLGVLAGPVSVAFFNRGVAYIQIPVLAVNAMAKVQFPAYARLMHDREALYQAVRGALRLSFLLGTPYLVALATGAPWLLPVMFGDRWTPSIVVGWTLVINMAGGFAASPLFTLMQARGEAALALLTFIAWTLATWALSGIAYAAGLSLAGIGAAHSVVTAVIVAALLRRTGRFLGRSLLPAIVPPLVSGSVAIAMHVALARFAPPPPAWARPIVWIVLPVVAYAAFEALLDGSKVFQEARSLIKLARQR